ncbi:MAG: hypothetical protein KH150_05875 [Bifidobacterium catenulatum]|nr:hypothetical protein [Bifidobacterium catenulatum]MBS6896960.1 hypothetical protein [Bifidobacterium catenulatum]
METPACNTVKGLPEALRRLLPASVNLATRIVKTTSLAVLLGVVEGGKL